MMEMCVSPRAFFDLATELLKRDSEASWRSAISRAYYSLFHECRTLLAKLGFVMRQSDQAHTSISRRLTQSGVARLLRLGQLLQEMKRVRNAADYDLTQALSQKVAYDEVDRIGASLQLLDQKLDIQDQQRAIDNIRRYERDVLREVTWQSPN